MKVHARSCKSASSHKTLWLAFFLAVSLSPSTIVIFYGFMNIFFFVQEITFSGGFLFPFAVVPACETFFYFQNYIIAM